MKILKLIGFMLLMANFLTAQNYSAPVGSVAGDKNTIIGVDAGTSSSLNTGNTALGYGALNTATNNYNVGIGYEAGKQATGPDNTFIGKWAGKLSQSGKHNVAIGSEALENNGSGNQNLAIGQRAGEDNTDGGGNIFMGTYAGKGNTTGGGNTYIGESAGNGQNGGANVAVGSRAGLAASDGTSNGYSVFLGANAGKYRPTGGQYKLYIQSQTQNSTNDVPLIYGDFNQKKLGIDTDDIPADYTLAVNGKAIVEELQVMEYIDWPDYVFAEDYNLMSLTDLEAEIETLGHLPGVPSAEEVEENGHALHLIDMNKEMTELRERNEALETRLSEVEDK